MSLTAYTISEMDEISCRRRMFRCRDSSVPGAVEMEAETIVYYHPVTEQVSAECAARRHWWQSAVLKGRVLPAEDGSRPFTLVDCPVPPFEYRKKAWKSEVLSESMENVLHHAPGIADVYLHPHIMTYMSETYANRWETCEETRQMLLASILSIYGAAYLRKYGQVTVLLGAPKDTEGQMEMTWRLLEPYLVRINSLLFYYREVEETDIWEELSAHLEMYYYEYGLVPQLVPYQPKEAKGNGGRTGWEGAVLDYGGSAGCVKIRPDREGIYVDVASCPEKERICTRKTGRTLYVSPLKYLDTMVKNSYDRLVR